MKPAHSRLKHQSQHRIDWSFFSKAQCWHYYLTHLASLILALAFYFSTYYILTTFHPQQIKNFIVVNTYLPLQLSFFLANFLFFSFLLLKKRRGLLISLFLSIWLFLKLQTVIMDTIFILGILFFFVIMEISLNYFDKLSCKHQPTT